jgi:LmbE family N-acetylglucosaminyl deacetylase
MASALRHRVLLALGAILVLATPNSRALPPASPAAIAQDLRSFANTGTVLHVGAHPDDENTELITWLSLGRGYRTAYLSLTRGDGGQNELGPDFGEKLGVLRTQELLAARRLDHGRQFFTRAIDFGYSKSPEETLRFWDRDQVLGDVVRVIRQFRPDVIVTRFPVPPGSGGHGHHTASAILALEAFKLAGDPHAYPEQLAEGLQPWQPKRVLWNAFRPGANATAPLPLPGPTFTQDIAGTDPVGGESFGLIAARSRSMHKTQGLGGFAARARTGPNEQTFLLLAGEPATADLMDGIDTTWSRVPGGAEIVTLAAAALANFKTDDPAASVPALLGLHRKLTALPPDPLIADKLTQLDRIIQSCLGLEVESTVDRAEIVPGEKLRITTTTRMAHAAGKPLAHVNPSGGLTALKPGEPDTHTVESATPADLPLTQPYWLREESLAGIARVSDPRLIGRPESPPTLSLRHEFAIDGVRIFVSDEPVQITRSEKGGQRQSLNVIAPVSLALGSEVYLVAPGTTKTVTVEITAARAGTAGTLQLNAPAGWPVVPATQNFQLTNLGDKARLAFQVNAPAEPASGYLAAVATVAGRSYSNQRVELRYEHLPVQLLQPPARAHLVSFPLALRSRHVGYLPGAGDSVAENLEQMGCTVRRLTGADLTPEKLAGLDAVVLGVRAFNERADLKDNFPGLLAWVETGGTVIAQYNRPNGLAAPVLGPYPLSIQGPAPQLRVTDETAPVTFLAPDHPALNTPNKITAADFSGWVQERGAYFPSTWEEQHYTALLAMNDPGEAPLKSSLLVAQHGKGFYVYTGLAFFRQLPAGNPGAYRLFANLISLGK